MRAPDDGWKRPWQELTCPADTRVSAETSEGSLPQGSLSSTLSQAQGFQQTVLPAYCLRGPAGPELLRDPPTPTLHLRTPSSPPSLSHPLGQRSGCSQQPGPGAAGRDAMHLGRKQRWPGEPASPSAGPTQVALVARTPTGTRQAASVDSGSEGGGLRACGLCQAGKHVPTRFKRRVFIHGPQRTALESRTANRRLGDGLSRAQCLLRTRSREGRVCFSPRTGDISRSGRSGHLLCFWGWKAGGGPGSDWVDRTWSLQDFLSFLFSFSLPGVAPLLALLRVIISHTFPAGFAAFLLPRWRARDPRLANRRLLQGICNQDPKTSAEATWLHI